MEKEIILSPEALYYLGSLLQAKYIDYAYVAALGDIKQNYALFEKETRASLVSSGILTEDFSGNLELDEYARKLLMPIFFGEVETSVNICTLGTAKSASICMFHFYNGAITAVTNQEGKLSLSFADQLTIRKLIASLVPAGYDTPGGDIAQLQPENISRFISLKSANLSTGATIKTYVESSGILYIEQNNQFVSISKDAFIADAYDAVKGV